MPGYRSETLAHGPRNLGADLRVYASNHIASVDEDSSPRPARYQA